MAPPASPGMPDVTTPSTVTVSPAGRVLADAIVRTDDGVVVIATSAGLRTLICGPLNCASVPVTSYDDPICQKDCGTFTAALPTRTISVSPLGAFMTTLYA